MIVFILLFWGRRKYLFSVSWNFFSFLFNVICCIVNELSCIWNILVDFCYFSQIIRFCLFFWKLPYLSLWLNVWNIFLNRNCLNNMQLSLRVTIFYWSHFALVKLRSWIMSQTLLLNNWLLDQTTWRNLPLISWNFISF